MPFFGAEKIPYSELANLEKNTPEIIVYAIPAMAFFTLLEVGYSWYRNKKIYKTKESIGSTLVGLGNVLINFFFESRNDLRRGVAIQPCAVANGF